MALFFCCYFLSNDRNFSCILGSLIEDISTSKMYNNVVHLYFMWCICNYTVMLIHWKAANHYGMHRCKEEDKDAYLYYILSVHGHGRTIVFCTSIAALRHISSVLRILDINIWPLHAQMQQRARLKVFFSLFTVSFSVLFWHLRKADMMMCCYFIFYLFFSGFIHCCGS